MDYTFWIMLLSAAALSILFALLKKLHYIEFFMYWGCFLTVEQQIMTVLSFNMKSMTWEPTLTNFWILKLCSIIIYPHLFLWLFVALLQCKGHIWKQLGFIVIWLGCIDLILLFHVHYHVLTLHHWRILYTLGIYAGILGFCLLFALFIRKLLRKEYMLT